MSSCTAGATPATSTATPVASQSQGVRPTRQVWAADEDETLLRTMLENKAFLVEDRHSRSRSRFWRRISEGLYSNHNIARNKRQCRDRFNLLYWKGLRAGAPAADQSFRALLASCLVAFVIDKDNNVALRPALQATPQKPGYASPELLSTSVPAGAPAGASALFECLQAQLDMVLQRVQELDRVVEWQRRKLDDLLVATAAGNASSAGGTLLMTDRESF
ncbi:LAMI_0D06876g1_1 [Lachancea mirantina]|uniref:LAMI_0D06876g1_1 n=1 Tax=Lachancea mirantina TaxID=1230905 RepID=A0A1G4JCA4_9SACH|nr:LAMI_0D06876g1_1 [Lachancea mirantina]